jgi:excisionase family DNA binding protein
MVSGISKGGDPVRQESLTLTIKEVAGALNISRGLAYKAVRDGSIPTIRIGRRLLVPRRALEKLLETPIPPDIREPGKQS